MDWHALSIKEAFRQLKSGEGGLSEQEVRVRLKKHGENSIRVLKRKTPLKIFLNQFKFFIVVGIGFRIHFSSLGSGDVNAHSNSSEIFDSSYPLRAKKSTFQQ